MSWLTPDWISAIGTVAAIAVALFLFFWDKWSGKASLTVTLRAGPPDWGFASLGVPEGEPSEEVFVLRIVANNGGRATARTVEATIHQVEAQKDGSWVPVRSFLPSSLRWTHTAERQLHLLIPGAGKHFDLGEVRQNGLTNDCMLIVSVTPQPVRAYNVLFPGVYRFSITLAAENAPAVRTRFELSFRPSWSSSDEAQLSQGITLKEIS